MTDPAASRSALYLALASILLVAIGLQRVTAHSPADATQFHERAGEIVAGIPYSLGEWEGADLPVPLAAVKLLRPNIIVGRVYRRPRDGARVSLAIIQCQDARDMAGHYPPICYPAHGWTLVSSEEGMAWTEPDVRKIARYSFERPDQMMDARMTVFNILLLPEVGPVSSMDAVRQAAGDPRNRSFGAAQVQIIAPAGMKPEAQTRIVRDFVRELEFVLDTLSSSR